MGGGADSIEGIGPTATWEMIVPENTDDNTNRNVHSVPVLTEVTSDTSDSLGHANAPLARLWPTCKEKWVLANTFFVSLYQNRDGFVDGARERYKTSVALIQNRAVEAKRAIANNFPIVACRRAGEAKHFITEDAFLAVYNRAKEAGTKLDQYATPRNSFCFAFFIFILIAAASSFCGGPQEIGPVESEALTLLRGQLAHIVSVGESAELMDLRNEHTKLSMLGAQYKATTEQFTFLHPESRALEVEYEREKSKLDQKNFTRLVSLKSQLTAAREAEHLRLRKETDDYRRTFKARVTELDAAIARQEEQDRATKADFEALIEEQLKLDQDLEAKRLDLANAAEEEDWEKCVLLESEIASSPKTALEMRRSSQGRPASDAGSWQVDIDSILGTIAEMLHPLETITKNFEGLLSLNSPAGDPGDDKTWIQQLVADALDGPLSDYDHSAASEKTWIQQRLENFVSDSRAFFVDSEGFSVEETSGRAELDVKSIFFAQDPESKAGEVTTPEAPARAASPMDEAELVREVLLEVPSRAKVTQDN